MTDYRVDDLAREGGTTVRNVRAYQDRGLLHPPRKEGRVGIYDDEHLGRLRTILDLLDRGWTLASIGEALDAIDRGDSIEHLLGLTQAIAAPWGDVPPERFTAGQLAELFGMTDLSPDVVTAAAAGAVAMDLLRPDGDGFVAPRPALLRSGAELISNGVPVEAALATLTGIRGAVESVASDMVDLVARHVVEPTVVDQRGTLRDLEPDRLASLAEFVSQVRSVAHAVVRDELDRALERASRARLADTTSRLGG